MKKHIGLVIGVVLVIGLIGTAWALQVPKKGVDKVNSALNIRESPMGRVLGTLSDGTPVEILAVQGSWYKVNTSGYSGKYVYSQYITVTEFDTVDDKEAARNPMAALRATDPNRTGAGPHDDKLTPQAAPPVTSR